MSHWFNHVKKILTQLLPYQCVLCGNRSDQSRDLCLPCQQDLPILTHSCPQCAREMHGKQCIACLKEPPAFDCIHALYAYQYPITRLVLTLKFNDALLYARILGELLAEELLKRYAHQPWPELIIPMPLHRKRLQERGFNQAVEIAQPVRKRLGISTDIKSCQRQKYTLPQAKLSALERKHNLQNCFVVAKGFSAQYVALLDDVVTTGHTVNEFTKALKAAGVKKIDVWCLARGQSLERRLKACRGKLKAVSSSVE